MEMEAQAVEFLDDPDSGGDRSARIDAAREEIRQAGTYVHTTEELAYGSRMAWRNHARCIGRLHWKSLRVIDRRDCSTAAGVAEACVDHLRYSTNGGNIRPAITVFAPERADGGQIRIWNSQLIRYAGYRRADGSVHGDPLNVEITEIAQRLGFRGKGTRFDVLPLVISMPDEPPQLFPVPRDAVLEVPISHPDYAWFTDLGLRWHALPAISNMCLEMGGLRYPAVPFNGWYVSWEIGARNLSDEDRYDMLPVVAEKMGLDTGTSRSLWKDRALVELNQAVLHSFQVAGVRIVDHHVATRQFLTHEEREARAGRTTPTDWSWVVPPISGSTAPTYHRSYPAPDPELRPNFFYQRDPWLDSELTVHCAVEHNPTLSD